MIRRWVIDTNVPVVANGRHDRDRPVACQCREAAITFLVELLDSEGRAVIDNLGEIQEEYRRYLRPAGQPGVGDRFYHELMRNPRLCERVALPKREDGEYVDLPPAIIESAFDRDDRKFAALARREAIPVVNGVDSDWLDARELLMEHDIRVEFLCGTDATHWFAT